MRFSDSSLAAWPMALVLAVAPAVCGCSFNVIMPPVSQDDSSVPEEEVSPIDLAAPDTGEDLTPEVVGPGCKVDADCETDVPVGAGPQCTLWGCDPQSQQCDWVAVKDGTACKGDDACVQSWKCMGGACKKHSSIDCDDKNPCTTDFCDSAKGCQHAAADGVGCNDGKQCTTGDVCKDKVCKGQEYCPTVALCEVGQCNDEGFCEYFATPGRPGCGDCSPWGVPGPEGAMLQCCQESGQVLVPRMFCEEDFPFVCGGTSQAECEELCAPFCQTNQQVCIPCGNGTCDEFENACNCFEDCGQGQTGCVDDIQCGPGWSCVGGVCQPSQVCTPEEICNDGKDNDCDQVVDEPDCLPEASCVPPPGYFQTSIADLVSVNPSAKPGAKIAFKGTPTVETKVQAPCEGPCCPLTKMTYKATDGGLKFVMLKGEVGCSLDACNTEPVCTPPEWGYYHFWGKYQKEQVDGLGLTPVPVLYVDGWCPTV